MSHSYRAFTLVELMIVVLIVAILAATAIPAISEAAVDLKLRSAARELMADLNYVRNLAITDGSAYALIFTGSGYSAVKAVDISDLGSNPVITHPIKHNNWVVSLQEQRITVKAAFAGKAGVCFDATGAPNAAGSVVLRCGTAAVTVSVEAATGRVTVTSGG